MLPGDSSPVGFSQLNTKECISGPSKSGFVELDFLQVNHDKQPFAAISHTGDACTTQQSDAVQQLRTDLSLAFSLPPL